MAADVFSCRASRLEAQICLNASYSTTFTVDICYYVRKLILILLSFGR